MKPPPQIEIWIDWIDSTQESDLIICPLTDIPRILHRLTLSWNLINRIQIVPFVPKKECTADRALRLVEELKATKETQEMEEIISELIEINKKLGHRLFPTLKRDQDNENKHTVS